MRVLLVNPSWRISSYLKTNVSAATLSHPVLSLAIIAADLLQNGHVVKILDLDLYRQPMAVLRNSCEQFLRDYVGITGTTPCAVQMINVSGIVKELNPKVKVVVGRGHATTLPGEFLKESSIDLVVCGEGDFTFSEIIRNAGNLGKVKGICFKKAGKIVKTQPRPLLPELGMLPMPAWHLFELDKYKGSHLTCRYNPVGPIETSRGCVFGCVYCNKTVFQRRFRAKSVKRVVDEMEYMLQAGFREIHVQDDGFSTDMKRAKGICDEITRRRLKFPWVLFNGIRVDRFDMELAAKLKHAGCYQIAFGIESGNQNVLDTIKKDTTLEKMRNAVKIARTAGLETFGFFMLGLPGDTEKTMQDTIDFAKSLDMDIVKFDITIPYPGTELYNDWDSRGLIKKKDWQLYLQHATDTRIYEHPNLS